MSALSLFRAGYDTMQIAEMLNISEGCALLRIHIERSREKGLEARYERITRRSAA